MNDRRMYALAKKEWRELFANVVAMLTFVLLPLGIVGVMAGLLWWIASVPPDTEWLQEIIKQLGDHYPGLSPNQQAMVVVNDQIIAYLLMMPAILPITAASFSVIGEKQERTIEPLMASPISTREILAAKTYAFVLPTLAATIGSYFIGALTVYFLADPVVLAFYVQSPWTLGICLLSPPLAIASTLGGLVASCRATDPKSAQAVSVAFILPALALSMALLLGVIRISVSLLGYAAALMLIADVLLLRLATKWFEREKVITSWK